MGGNRLEGDTSRRAEKAKTAQRRLCDSTELKAGWSNVAEVTLVLRRYMTAFAKLATPLTLSGEKWSSPPVRKPTTGKTQRHQVSDEMATPREGS